MARGLQKAQSQQKNAEKLKKAAGGSSNLKAQAAAVKLVSLPTPDFDALEAAARGPTPAPAAGGKKK
ncbi:Zinc finger protein 706 [Phaffia rhodozyma]|uniref:Zinc finger protein 706 n=1 Tax=Phaffia rhodozyma TaxID=264483 RepID=A0A0F7SG17_PHARH|nr:Zinc finger protein 706 [Phaffia rhodozyma]